MADATVRVAPPDAGDAELLRALAHPVRLALLAAISRGERPVGQIESDTGITQPSLSQHLAVLRKAQFVATRREAKQVFYRLNPTRIAGLAGMLMALAGETPPAPIAPASADPTPGRMSGAAAFARIG